jgi:hypothetical protein
MDFGDVETRKKGGEDDSEDGSNSNLKGEVKDD